MTSYRDSREERIRTRRSKRKQARLARVRRQVIRYLFLAGLFYLGCSGFVRVPWAPAEVDRDVEIVGADVVAPEQIKAVLAPYMGRPVYAIDPSQVESRLRTLADVHKAMVRRHLLPRPHLVVYILEEFPWASFSAGPDSPCTSVITQTGRFVPVSLFPRVPRPALTIFGAGDFKMNEADVRMWANWVQYISTQTGKEVLCVDLRKPTDIRVLADDLMLRLGSADTTLSKRLSRLSSIMPALSTIKQPLDYVDLAFDSNVPLKLAKGTKPQSASSTRRYLENSGQAWSRPESQTHESALSPHALTEPAAPAGAPGPIGRTGPPAQMAAGSGPL